MITATEPLEYFPRGRLVVDNHPGPNADEELPVAGQHPVDLLLLQRLQNVNISLDEREPAEFYRLRELPLGRPATATAGRDVTPPYVCTEEELYVCGPTAVWTRCISNEPDGLPQKTFTCDTPIRFAFFCPRRFVRPDTASPSAPDPPESAICLIEKDTLHVFLDGGDTYKAMLQCPVSAVWMMPDGILLEQQTDSTQAAAAAAAAATWSESVPWPRLFTLTFPLEEMKPVLLLTGLNYGFLQQPDYRVVFTSEQVALVLLYVEPSGKHVIYKLRLTEEEDLPEARYAPFAPDTADSEASYAHQQTGDASALYHGSVAGTSTVGGGLAGASKLGASASVSSRFGSFQLPNNPFSDQASRLAEDVLSGLDRHGIAPEQQEPRSEPLAPQYCLEHVWTVGGNGAGGPGGNPPGSTWSATDGEMATGAFLHTDLVGNTYICFLQARACRLTLVQYSPTALNVLGISTLPARSAVSLEQVNLIVLLDPTGRLVLYSGCIAVGKLHLNGLPSSSCFRAHVTGAASGPGAAPPPPPARPPFVPNRPSALSSSSTPDTAPSSTGQEGFPRRSTLLPNVSPGHGKFEEELHLLSPVRPVPLAGTCPSGSKYVLRTDHSPIVALRDATGSRFTLVFGNERLVRLSLAPLAESHLVRSCLAVLRHALPTTTMHELLIHWYSTRNVPGSHAGLSAHQEWDLFRTLLFTMMGRPVGPPDADDRAADAAGQPAGSGSCPCAEEPKKRRRGDATHGQPADWEFLVRHATDRPAEGVAEQPGGRRPYQRRELNSLYPHIPDFLQMLHLLYEDFKLNVCRADELRRLADFLYCLAADAQLAVYQLHYLVDFPELFDRYRRHGSCLIEEPALFGRLGESLARPPAIFRYLERLLAGCQGADAPFPHRPGINDLSYDMLTLVAYIYRVPSAQRWVRQHLASVLSEEFFAAQRTRPLALQATHPAGRQATTASFERTGDTVLAFLVARGYTRDQLEQLPIALRYLVLNYLEGCRQYLSHGLQAVYYELLLRPELRAHGLASGLPEWVPDLRAPEPTERGTRQAATPQYDEIASWQHEMSEIEVVGAGSAGPTGGPTAAGIASGTGSGTSAAPKEDGLRPGQPTQDEDGMGGMDGEVLQLRFPDDRRIEDVRSFLNSAARIQINLPQSATTPDHEFLEEQERRLYMLCLRTMALPVGRGMLTVCSSRPSETETVRVPRLCLSGRDVTRGTTIEIQQIEVPANMSLWPAFHNGVAAGLRIYPDTPHLTSTWITNNRQGGGRSALLPAGTDTSTEHGGFLMALGLTGHLRKLSLYSIFDYMLRSDEMVRLGLMVGLSAAYRGTSDLTITRLLAVHVEALLPPTAVELDISQNLQVAALFGVGLLYQGTAKRHMVEVLLQEIGRPPGPEMENYVERESYALTAGLALGLVTLGLGDCSSSLHDLALPDTLYYYMNGGNRRLMVGAQKEKYRLPSFQIKEGPTVNVDVTAPGATLALGLMYFATGNEPIARLLEPPNTLYILQHLRPDLLQLRTVARHLIHWHRIEPTCGWVEQQLPDLLRQNISLTCDAPQRQQQQQQQQPQDDAMGTAETAEESDAPGDGGGPAFSQRLSKFEQVLYSQAYCSVVCGSAVAIGLRYAGTASESAVETLDHYLQYFIEQGVRLHKGSAEPPTSLARLVGSQVIENCTMMLLLALSLVLAGTGSLRVLRPIRMLRSRIGFQHVTYGSHMAVHMALGFLFLGAGRFTLSRSPEAIAALVCAIFPKFPTYSNDNRYHLQAFRHLYVLAIEPRIFLPRSIDTGRLSLCRIRYAAVGREHQPVEQFAPCLLPELGTLAWLEVCDENFWHFRFDRRHNWQILESIFKKNERVDVKQRTGCLTYQEDPTRLITSQLNAFSQPNHSRWHFEPLNLLQLVDQPDVINTTRTLLLQPDRPALRWPIEPAGHSDELRHSVLLYARLVADSVMGDRLHGLPILLGLTQILQDDKRRTNKSLDAWQLRLLRAALEKQAWPHRAPDARCLVASNLLQSLLKRIWQRCDEQRARYRTIIRQYLQLGGDDDSHAGQPQQEQERRGVDPERRREQLRVLVKLIVLYELPYDRLLQGGLE
ncbi:anaphase-promoting complex subunit 1 [Anopheles merus]|nr:anaphase-promoting complex subunit 1 [Anopheles merus]